MADLRRAVVESKRKWKFVKLTNITCVGSNPASGAMEITIKFQSPEEKSPNSAGPYLIYFAKHGIKIDGKDIEWFERRESSVCATAYFSGQWFYNHVREGVVEIYDAQLWAEYPGDHRYQTHDNMYAVCNCGYCQYLRSKYV